jgi:glycosyltransferase involved in cell wall biosynthesis
MRVSVIIPVFNGAGRLAAAVASVRPQLHAGDELIIVDDGSTDATPAVIAALGPGVTALRQHNAGASAARNAGLRRATGEAVAFLDHDDLWTPHRQSALRAVLQHDAGVGVAVGRVDIAVDAALAQPEADHPRYATVHRPWHLDAVLIRRAVFDRVGPFNETLRCAEDADWFMRARDAGVRFQPVDMVTVTYQLHAANSSRDVARGRSDLLRALQAAAARRRAAR